MRRGRFGFIGAVALAGCLPLLTASSAGAAQDVVYQCGDDLCLIDPFSPTSPAPTNITQTTGVGGASASENYPSWSPDGSMIAFKGIYSPNTIDVFTTDTVPGGIATNVSQTDDRTEENLPPQWSPGGNRLAFGAKYDSSGNPLKYEVYVSPASGTSIPLAIGSSNSDEEYPTWSPDGTKIAFARNGVVYTANADGSGPLQLVPDTFGAVELQWSPDGTRIAYLNSSDRIQVVRVDGVGDPITFPGTVDGDGPQWSPDSSHLVWTADSEGPKPFRIVVAPSDNSTPPVDIPPATTGSNVPHRPTFSADGKYVVFEANDGVTSPIYRQIFLAKADGSAPATRITSAAENSAAPDWKPGTTTPVDPPIDPPVNPTRPAATINLARAFGPGGAPYNPYKLSVSVNCNAQGGSGNHPACQTDGIAKGILPKRNPRTALAKAKPKVFAKGSTTIQGGETGTLKLKVTKAGKKVKPGAKFKLELSVTVKSDGFETVTEKKTIKVKVPKKKR